MKDKMFRPQDDLTDSFFKFYKKVKGEGNTMDDFVEYLESIPVSRGIGTKKMDLYSFNEMNTITMLDGITGTITCRNAQNYNKKFLVDSKLYKPSPLMCWLLMGYSEEQYNIVAHFGDKHLYNQAGNSIVVDVVYNIFDELLGDL